MSPSAPAAQEKREFASEIKFLLDPAAADRVRGWARERLAPDPNASGQLGDTYEVTSLYFDTPELDVFTRRGPHHRSKFRVRRYDGRQIFLERKLKVGDHVAKRRTPITAAELSQLAEMDRAAAWPGSWFGAKAAARRLQPICQISYQRTARVMMTETGPIRLTLDTTMLAVPNRSLVFYGSRDAISISDFVVLELKFRRFLPALFRELVAHFALSPQPFSKYRTALPALGLAPSGVALPASPAALLSCLPS
jgi:inorganic triphosphatase YgiF